MSGIREKFKANKIKNSYYIITLSLVLIAVLFFLLVGNFKSYRSEISIILVPKSTDAVVQSEQIIQNLEELPLRLSFYEKLLKDNEEIDDQFAGYAKDKKKKLWNRNINISRKKNGSIIDLEVTAKSRIQSLKMSKQSAITLFSIAGNYYDVKKDIDLRIVDGPITEAYLKNWHWLFLISTVFGIILAYLMSFVAYSFKLPTRHQLPCSSFLKKEKNKELGSFPPQNNIAKGINKHQAPDNLPVGSESYPFPEEISQDSSYGAEDMPAKPDTDEVTGTDQNENVDHKTAPDEDGLSEPTEEELKKRLNQLLRGTYK